MSNRIVHGARAADVIKSHYMQVANAVFRDKRLTPKAKGVFGYMWSHEDGFGLTIESIAEAMGVGVSMIASALKELEKYGYLVRRRFRNDDGTWNSDTVYELTDMPDGLVIVAGAPYDAEGNRRSQPTCENRGLDGDAGNPRSEPTCDFPSLDNPSLENRGPKNNNRKNTSPLRGDVTRARDTQAREGTTSGPDVNDDRHQTHGSGGATGKAGKERPPAKVALSADWRPSPELLTWAATSCPGVDVDWWTADFVAYWSQEQPNAKKTPNGWNQAWRNLIRAKWEQKGSPAAPQPPGLFDAPEQDETLMAEATSIAEAWVGWFQRRNVPVLASQKLDLRKRVLGALAAGATPDAVKDALRELQEVCPPEWRLQKQLAGESRSASPATMARQEREQTYRNLQFGRGLQRDQQRAEEGTLDDPMASVQALLRGAAADAAQALRDTGELPPSGADAPFHPTRGEIA